MYICPNNQKHETKVANTGRVHPALGRRIDLYAVQTNHVARIPAHRCRRTLTAHQQLANGNGSTAACFLHRLLPAQRTLVGSLHPHHGQGVRSPATATEIILDCSHPSHRHRSRIAPGCSHRARHIRLARHRMLRCALPYLCKYHPTEIKQL